MKLTTKAIETIKKHTRTKNRLALALDCSGFTVERWIKENEEGEEDNSLTKAVALDIIMEETKLPIEEILDREQINAPLK